MKKLIKQIAALLLMLTAMITIGKAQTAQAQPQAQTANATPPDTIGIAKFAANLGVSTVKAIQIRQAMHYRQTEIGLVVRDKKLSSPEKQVAVSKYLHDRRLRLDSLLTPKQQAFLQQRDSQSAKLEAADRADAMKRHEAQMTAIPHQRTIRTDTTKHPLLKVTQ